MLDSPLQLAYSTRLWIGGSRSWGTHVLLKPFYSLELNIHQRILSDIATNVGDTRCDVTYARDIIGSKVQTRGDVKEAQGNTDTDKGPDSGDGQGNAGRRVFMVRRCRILPNSEHSSFCQPASRVHCNIAFGELVVNFPDVHIADAIDTLMPALIDVLRDVPFIDFDRCLSWEGMAFFRYNFTLICLPSPFRLGTARSTRLLDCIRATPYLQLISPIQRARNSRNLFVHITNRDRNFYQQLYALMSCPFPILTHCNLSIRRLYPADSCSSWSVPCCQLNHLSLEQLSVEKIDDVPQGYMCTRYHRSPQPSPRGHLPAGRPGHVTVYPAIRRSLCLSRAPFEWIFHGLLCDRDAMDSAGPSPNVNLGRQSWSCY